MGLDASDGSASKSLDFLISDATVLLGIPNLFRRASTDTQGLRRCGAVIGPDVTSSESPSPSTIFPTGTSSGRAGRSPVVRSASVFPRAAGKLSCEGAFGSLLFRVAPEVEVVRLLFDFTLHGERFPSNPVRHTRCLSWILGQGSLLKVRSPRKFTGSLVVMYVQWSVRNFHNTCRPHLSVDTLFPKIRG